MPTSGRSLAFIGLILTLVAGPVIAGAGLPDPKSGQAGGAASERPRTAGLYVDVTDAGLTKALEALAPTGALTAFPGDQFRPSRPITLGEFARAAAAAFDVTVPAGDEPGQAAVQALAERGVLPRSERLVEGADLALSVTNALSAVVRLSGMGEVSQSWPGTGPASAPLEVAQAAGIVPESIGPDDATRHITRAEAVELLYQARTVSTVNGKLALAGQGSATVESQKGPVRVRLTEGTLVVRNGKPSSVESLQSGDRVAAVVDPAGYVRVVSATGSNTLNQTEVLAKAQQLLQEVAQQLTPEQWQMVLQGDWKALSGTLMPQLYDRLMAVGIAPWEADALLNRDWASVRELAADRLAEEGAQRLNVSPELLRSVLAQDWGTARQLAQQELIEKVINELVLPNAAPGAGSAPGPSSAPGVGRS